MYLFECRTVDIRLCNQSQAPLKQQYIYSLNANSFLHL